MVYLLVLALIIMVCVYKRMYRGGEGGGSTMYVCGTHSQHYYDQQPHRRGERYYGQSHGDAWSHDREVAKHGYRY